MNTEGSLLPSSDWISRAGEGPLMGELRRGGNKLDQMARYRAP